MEGENKGKKTIKNIIFLFKNIARRKDMSSKIERIPKGGGGTLKIHIVRYISAEFQNIGKRKDLKSFQGRKLKFYLKEWHQTSHSNTES